MEIKKGVKWQPERDPDVEQFDCGNEEKHAILYYFALETQAAMGRAIFGKRLKRLPKKYKKAYNTGMYFLRRAMDGVWLSLPEKTQVSLNRTLINGVCEIKPKTSLGIGPEVEIVDRADFRDVCNMVIADRCSICLEDATGVKKCKLRKIMNRVCPPAILREYETHCPYWDVAASHTTGDYFSHADVMNYDCCEQEK